MALIIFIITIIIHFMIKLCNYNSYLLFNKILMINQLSNFILLYFILKNQQLQLQNYLVIIKDRSIILINPVSILNESNINS